MRPIEVLMMVQPYRHVPPAANGFLGSKAHTFTGNGAGGTISIPLTDLKDASNASVTLAQDDFILVCYTVGPGGFVDLDLTTTAPSGWTVRQDRASSGTASTTNLAIWHKKMGSSPDTTIAVPNQANGYDVGVAIMVFRGIHTSTPFDVSDVYASTAGANPDPAAITPSTAGAIIVVAGSATVRNITSLLSWALPTDLSATANHWCQAAIDTSPGTISAIGIKTNWVSGSFNPAQWTGANVHATGCSQTVTMALKPA